MYEDIYVLPYGEAFAFKHSRSVASDTRISYFATHIASSVLIIVIIKLAKNIIFIKLF